MIGVIASLFGWGFTKVFSPLGLSFLEPLLKHYESKEVEATKRTGQFTEAIKASLDAEVQARRVGSAERIALWGDPWYKSVIMLIVVPPAFYSAAVFGDSVFGFEFDIDAAPARFEELGFNILMTFIGASGAVGAVAGLKNIWRK